MKFLMVLAIAGMTACSSAKTETVADSTVVVDTVPVTPDTVTSTGSSAGTDSTSKF